MGKNSFSELFTTFRLRSEFSSLSSFGKQLAEEGIIYDDSIFYHWQKNKRVPRRRAVLFTIIKIFKKKGGIKLVSEANTLLESVGLQDLNEQEISDVFFDELVITSIPSKKIISFLTLIGKSKLIRRTGWVREKIKNPESVAEHSYRVSVLAMVFADELRVNKEKLIKMAILHDLGETITGDVVWSRGSMIDIHKRTLKEAEEEKGIEKIFQHINLGEEYKTLYREMIERKTTEARIFWQLDKLEMALQALEYEKAQGVRLDEFFVNANLQIFNPFLKKLMNAIIQARSV